MSNRVQASHSQPDCWEPTSQELVPVLEDRKQRLEALQAEVDAAAQKRKQAEALILTMQTRAAGLQESLDVKATDLLRLSAGIRPAEEAQALADERGRALEIATEQLKAADAMVAKAKAGAAGEAGDMRKLVDAGVAEREALQAEVERLTLEVAAKVQVSAWDSGAPARERKEDMARRHFGGAPAQTSA